MRRNHTKESYISTLISTLEKQLKGNVPEGVFEQKWTNSRIHPVTGKQEAAYSTVIHATSPEIHLPNGTVSIYCMRQFTQVIPPSDETLSDSLSFPVSTQRAVLQYSGYSQRNNPSLTLSINDDVSRRVNTTVLSYEHISSILLNTYFPAPMRSPSGFATRLRQFDLKLPDER